MAEERVNSKAAARAFALRSLNKALPSNNSFYSATSIRQKPVTESDSGRDSFLISSELDPLRWPTDEPHPPLRSHASHAYQESSSGAVEGSSPRDYNTAEELQAHDTSAHSSTDDNQSFWSCYSSVEDMTKGKMPVPPRTNDSPPAYSGVQPAGTSAPPRVVPLAGINKLNILVLGETGVGKSTFINAFANYLKFGSLEAALQMQKPACIIPSSFTWQSLEGDEYITRNIKVVPNTGVENVPEALEDEYDSERGQSATQLTKIYRVDVGGTKVSLIDTPGIGDTRGAAQDKQNMDNILAKLRSLKELNGILILLTPNNARLEVMFKFCMKELLTHLHRDAAKNIVFGFTNARNTSFKPGETYAVLKHMLDSDPSIGIKLNRNTTYCFDSEGFRCLAAHSNGIDIHDMGDIKDYASSWTKSAAETYRLLEHFRPTTTWPHQVENTLSLNQTRNLVRILTKPMADITQTINSNIALIKDEKDALESMIKKRQGLKAALEIFKVVYEVEELDKPRTVCSDKSCVEFKDGKKHYKTLCHDPCHLKGVEVDKVQCEQLLGCRAFEKGRSEKCRTCGHRWQAHLHIQWEAREKIIKVTDEAVAQRVKDNASDVEVANTAFISRQEIVIEYKGEQSLIQYAAGLFSVYLKQSSIKPYNDSKLDYLDHLIQEETSKVQVGGPRKRLDDLVADREQHVEEVRALTEGSDGSDTSKILNQREINRLIQLLCNLKHVGPDLVKAAQTMEGIEQSTHHKGKGASTISQLSTLAPRPG